MWREDGKKYSQGVLKEGKKHGEWTYWDENGKASVRTYNE